jgi:hypothetical protein
VTGACDGTVDGGQRAALRWVGNVVRDSVEVDGFLSDLAVCAQPVYGGIGLVGLF